MICKRICLKLIQHTGIYGDERIEESKEVFLT